VLPIPGTCTVEACIAWQHCQHYLASVLTLLLQPHLPTPRFVLHRFMRVLTTALPMASQPAQLYASCDGDATACLVVHKALETAADRGAVAARQMLFDCEPITEPATAWGGATGRYDGRICQPACDPSYWPPLQGWSCWLHARQTCWAASAKRCDWER